MEPRVARALAALSVLVAHALLAAPRPARAQQVAVLAEDLCETCSIEITPDIVLGTDGESVIAYTRDLHRLADGRFVMTFDYTPGEFTVFAADGSSFRRIGRQGEGPGEYQRVYRVRDHDGRFHVFDQVRRMTVLDADFTVVRTAPVPCWECTGGDMEILQDGSAVLNSLDARKGEPPMTARDWFAIQVVGQEGEFHRQLDEVRVVDLAPVEEFRRALEVAPDGSVLSAHIERYRIDRWDPETGELLSAHARDVDWFPAPDPDRRYGPPDPPRSVVTGMELDPEGRLWISLARAAPDWRDRLERRGRPGNPEGGSGWRYGPGSWQDVLEVLDIDAGRVLFSQVLEGRDDRLRLIAPGWLAHLDEEGLVPVYRTYRVQLVGMSATGAQADPRRGCVRATSPTPCRRPPAPARPRGGPGG